MDGNLQANLFKSSTCVSQEELRQYLGGNMGKEGTRRVENHLLDCPLCSDAADGLSEMEAHLPTSLSDFSNFEKKMLGQSGAAIVPMRQGRLLRRLAAVAAVLVVGAVAYLNLSKPPSGPALYQAYYFPYENDIPYSSRRAGVTDVDPNFAAALMAYDERKFSTAASLFERALVNEPDNDAARFFAGISFLEMEQAGKAAGQFQPVAEGKGTYASKAAWYLALCDLKLDRLDSAKVRLDRQVEANGHMYRQAKELREKL